MFVVMISEDMKQSYFFGLAPYAMAIVPAGW
jgi:hypothetical protein